MKSLLFFLTLLPAHAASILWDPLPYLSEADSPFYHGIINGHIYLENFEDQALNTPFVREPVNAPYYGLTIRSVSPNPPSTFIRSVDKDDGIIDFNSDAGDSWITINKGGGTGGDRASFEFLPNNEGLYPSYVGIVITAANDVDRDVELTFRDLNGIDLFSDTEYDPKLWNTGLFLNGDTRTHRFVGVYNENGIQSLALSNVWQLDHLQYGVIPEPSSSLLTIAALLTLFNRCRS